jgi:hypothetical protein
MDLSSLAKPGDECLTCKPFWTERRHEAPRIMVALGVATDFGVPIVVCPYCDGAPLLRNKRRGDDSGELRVTDQ